MHPHNLPYPPNVTARMACISHKLWPVPMAATVLWHAGKARRKIGVRSFYRVEQLSMRSIAGTTASPAVSEHTHPAVHAQPIPEPAKDEQYAVSGVASPQIGGCCKPHPFHLQGTPPITARSTPWHAGQHHGTLATHRKYAMSWASLPSPMHRHRVLHQYSSVNTSRLEKVA
jgi:hypothetical protein